MSFFTPTARQTYKRCTNAKILLFCVFVYWVNLSITTQPALAGLKWGTLFIAGALAVGLVLSSGAAAKGWFDPKRQKGKLPESNVIIMTALAIFFAAADIYFVSERINAQRANPLNAGGGGSDFIAYALSSMLLLVNLLLSVIWAKSYYAAGLDAEAKAAGDLDAAHEAELREKERLAANIDADANLGVIRKKAEERIAKEAHLSAINGSIRRSVEAHEDAKATREEAFAAEQGVDAMEKILVAAKRLAELAREFDAAGVRYPFTINGTFKDVTGATAAGHGSSGAATTNRYPPLA